MKKELYSDYGRNYILELLIKRIIPDSMTWSTCDVSDIYII